ncbi:hypothetical protein ABZ883_26475 [Streptomyces sp. NPDC046977]|uniref:hypothetical protein n=1 Tax=Streptomyces sp. NPDC046977 TaxID=3154703 RepID=UPI00340E0D89
MVNIPVVRAEAYYLPPPRRRADSWDAVPPAERVWRWYELKVQRRMQPPAGMLIGQRQWARIDHNRWVSDCPCGSAQVVTPADRRFACPECGYGWIEVVFPEDVDAVEASVANDIPSERNWWNPDDPNPWNRPPDTEVPQ